MADKFKGFWMMEAGERDEKYLHPATAEDVATQLRDMGYIAFMPQKWLKQPLIDPGREGHMTPGQAREHFGLKPVEDHREADTAKAGGHEKT